MNERVEIRGGGRIQKGAAVITLVGVITLIPAGIFDPRELFFAYLTAYNFVVSIALGALVFLMICHAMHAGWPTLLRRLTEAMVAAIPLHALLFVPILLGLPVLYPWVRPDRIADPRLRRLVGVQAPYLNVGWFVIRAVFFFAVWTAVGFWLRRWSQARDRGAGAAVDGRMYALSGVMLPLVALTLSFASFDWIMSLTPEWHSTMFPVYYFAGGFLGALALLTVLTFAADRAGLIGGINGSHYYALGRLLLSFVIFWAYVAFFQLLLIWSADRPDEVTFYLARLQGGWVAVTVILVLGQFVLPFLALLSYDLKRRPALLTGVAVWLLVAHYVDVYWLVMPAAPRASISHGVVDVGALLALGGLSVIHGVWRLRGVPLVPLHDPALAEALRYESL
jgi:hypothetical protein